MELIKLLVALPKWIFLLAFRVPIAILNFSTAKKAIIVERTRFYKTITVEGLDVTFGEDYVIAVPRQLCFGYYLVAKLRNYIRTETVTCIDSNRRGGISPEYTVRSQEQKKVIFEGDLKQIIQDCIFISHQS